MRKSRFTESQFVQVWTAFFRELAPYDSAALAVMAEDERNRERTLRFAADRWRFRLGRLFLRSVLATLVDVPAHRLRFGRTASGKPFLELPQQRRIPRFNLSHCRDLVCLAATDGCELGVDVEALRPMIDCRAIARHTFTDVEMSAVECAARPDVEFFRIWTCREAVGKAIGTGLSGSLLSISAGCGDGRTTSWCGIDGSGRRRRLQVFNIGDDSHAAALAVETEGAVRVDPVVFKPAELLQSPGRSGR